MNRCQIFSKNTHWGSRGDSKGVGEIEVDGLKTAINDEPNLCADVFEMGRVDIDTKAIIVGQSVRLRN